MIRLFINHPLTAQNRVLLTENQFHYLIHVMRQKTGDSVLAFNGYDGEWQCCLEQLDKKQGFIKPISQTREQSIDKKCVLCPAVIKKENMDLILQKATELGVTHIRPILTRYTVVRQFNLSRAQAIVTEAAEQSERLNCPIVDEPVSFETLLSNIKPDETLVYLSERNGSTKNAIMGTPCFLIGPEGGFAPAEIQLLSERPNTVARHLGQTILRAETACIAALACWQYKGCF